MHSYLARFNSLYLALLLSLISLAAAANSEIDPSWKKHHVSISYIDSEKRLFVASDREFYVPFNTPIYNPKGDSIALISLKRGDSIWLYVDRDNSKAIKLIAMK